MSSSSLQHGGLAQEGMVDDVLSDTEDELLQPVLPVSRKPITKPGKPPATGEEYLQMVRLEASKTQNVTVSDNVSDRSSKVKMAGWVKRGWANAETTLIEEQDRHNRESGLVDEEWENRFLERFQNLRKALQLHMDEASKGSPSSGDSLYPPAKLPKSQDEAGWSRFCYGLNFSGVDSPKLTREDEGDEVAAMMLPSWHIISRMDQPTTIALLSYHIRWLNTGMSIAKSQWLFALLIRIDKILTPDQMSILRGLCRKCIDIRRSLMKEFSTVDNEDDTTLASLNMIITIIRNYFGQRDLG
ncbi:16103_t:CDS:2 [Acaulospora colombiana]|uniref:16103_t:CDS:1 n=1 Tax=Acaulospora colombiana TaxID=27376 RepID=A0ACA9L5A6_9GLOM|nr:16103_t:CDS:2 [Acaulospora colombiana]